MNGKSITIKASDDGPFSGYLSVPRSGSGPGLIVLQEIFGVNSHIRAVADRWAEEGYMALAPDMFWRIEPNFQVGYTEEDFAKARAMRPKFDWDEGSRDIQSAIDALRAQPQCSGKVGAVGYCFGGALAFLAATRTNIDAAIGYYGGGIDHFIAEAKNIKSPLMLHYGATDAAIAAEARETVRAGLAARDDAEVYVYANAGHGFNNWDRKSAYHPFSSQLARSRSIGLLSRTIGPRYDLSALWDAHCVYEFDRRDADATMATMVPDPCVTHIPNLTGGTGYEDLRRFYQDHFTTVLPKDMKVEPISRTIGPDRVVDEVMVSFTHDREVDFILPGLKPTGKHFEVPFIVVIEFRGDKLASERIYWDQASALVQLGLLNRKGLPVLGDEATRMLNGEAVSWNELIPSWRAGATENH